MKELSIEEKAKRYDEAINKMKHYVVDEYGYSRIKVADVFLELEEGENIRIIKAIEYGLDYVFTNNTTVFEVTKEQCLAWLEKQGQKPAAWSEEDNNMLKWVIGYLNNKMLNAPISEERTACKNAIAWLEKQGEQKPAEWTMDNIEELTEFENAMMHIGGSFFGEHQGLDPNDTDTIKEQANILLGLVAKQEWSERDENHIKSILSTLEYCKAQFPNAQAVVEAYNADIEWLKSLRPQNT